jgi:hypothetical protein
MFTHYEIRVKGHLSLRWSQWFDGMAIRHEPNGETTLYGPIPDQAALFGLLIKIHNLNLPLISVNPAVAGAAP